MHEILIDRRQVVAPHQRVHQVLAYRHQCSRTTGCKIDPPEQLLAARLGGAVQLGRSPVGPLARPGIDRRVDALAINAESGHERLEERDARARRQLVVSREQFARQGDARGLAAAGQQLLAELNQAVRSCRSVTTPVTRPIDQRATALRDRLQHVAEEGGIHHLPCLHRVRRYLP